MAATSPFLFTAFMTLVMLGLCSPADARLEENFYGLRCPLVETIVREAVAIKMAQTFTTVPATLRLFFHDCFVEGCDASIMIASPNGDAEKDSDLNLTLPGDGFDTVIKAKQTVEAVCPGIVSCADVLAMATRDVVVLSGGPWFDVELGRRDGLVSEASRVAGKLPKPNFKLDQLNSMFASHNLTQLDMIALSGAHTVGSSHCKAFTSRIHSTPIDPTLDPAYAQQLIAACPKNNTSADTIVDMDPQTPRKFDSLYYQELVQRKGLFTSDQDLFENGNSKGTVVDFASNGGEFERAFAAAMRKLGRVGVKVGAEGEIRRDCAAFNG
uniref:Peroxidase n=1 Tax=Kalanchoe fedtschenkoi TaxID=63787 RepID=A0A7N0URL4_KALFE